MVTPSVSSTAHTTTPTPSRINLLDNTIPAALSSSPSGSEENLASAASSAKAPGRRETLRKAIAQRKYKRWSTDPFPSDEYLSGSTSGNEELPDPRAGGVVERVGEDEIVGSSSADSTPEEGVARGRERSDTGGNKKKVNGEGNTERRTGRKKDGKQEKEIAQIDILYENQRGMFICGIPFFSAKGLLNFDPSPWQNSLYHNSAVSIVDAQVPDPSWTWAWKTWYVDMTSDVDEEGWTYSFSFNPTFSWHGTHIWFHSFVRRRRWLRKRVKLHGHESGSSCSSRNGSRERGHGLNQDYFTIHSHTRQTNIDGSTIIGGKKKRSVMGGEGWSWKDEDGDGVEDSEQAEKEGIKDIPMLMNILRTSRLDREKIEAVENFLSEGGEEVEYLAERIPTIMALMVFQASRRNLLLLLIREAEAAEKTESSQTPAVSTPSTPPAPLPPSPSEPTTPLSQISASSQNVLLPPSPVEPPNPPLAVPIDHKTVAKDRVGSPETEQEAKERLERKIQALKSSITIAEEEVRRMEYWSDVAGASANGETTLATEDEIGLSGAKFTAGEGGSGKFVGSVVKREAPRVSATLDRKGKGKDTSV